METLIRNTAMALRRHCPVLAIVVVGSAANNKLSPHDIDFLALGDWHKSTTSEMMHAVAKDLGSESISSSDDAWQLKIEGSLPVSIAPMTVESFTEYESQFSSGSLYTGERRSWAIGCRLPEAFAGDVSTCKILYDPTCVVSELQKKLGNYPDNAREAILRYSSREISNKFRTAYESEDVIVRTVSRGDVVIALIRAAHAFDSIYLRTLKRIDYPNVNLSTQANNLLWVADTIARMQESVDEAMRHECRDRLDILKKYME